MNPNPENNNRRDFLKKSVLTSLALGSPHLLSGLVKADGGGGGQQTTQDPLGTTGQTTFATTPPSSTLPPGFEMKYLSDIESETISRTEDFFYDGATYVIEIQATLTVHVVGCLFGRIASSNNIELKVTSDVFWHSNNQNTPMNAAEKNAFLSSKGMTKLPGCELNAIENSSINASSGVVTIGSQELAGNVISKDQVQENNSLIVAEWFDHKLSIDFDAFSFQDNGFLMYELQIDVRENP